MSDVDRQEPILESAIREELERILTSRIFAQSERLARFLRFTIESVLSGESDSLKEYVIGAEVYDRKPPYLPSQDSIVRSEARRLRSKLKDYYETEGSTDPVLINFRPGSYVPVICRREEITHAATEPKSVDGSLLVEGKGISIAVIPFKDISGTTASLTCANVITDELIHELMRTEGCRVTSASSSDTLHQAPRNLPALAQEMGVQIFFEGSVRAEGRTLRITARIITADGFQLWSQRFDTEPEGDELFSISEQIARSFINRTRPELSSIRKLKASAGSDIWNTYSAVLSAESSLDEGTTADLQLAKTRFEEVLAVSPRNPRPHCGIAQCYYELALRGADISTADLLAALERAQRASELDAESVQARGCIAALLALEWRWDAAHQNFQQAFMLGSHAATCRQYALYFAVHARFDEAWHYLQQAQHVDPFSLRQKIAWARFFHISRRYRELDRHFPERLIHGRVPAEAQLYRALTYIELGRADEAARIAHELRQSFGVQPALAACLAEVMARCGDLSPARELVAAFGLLSNPPTLSHFRQALLSIALGDRSTALSLLSVAFDNREPELIWLAVDPRLDGIRNDPNFVSIANRVMSAARSS